MYKILFPTLSSSPHMCLKIYFLWFSVFYFVSLYCYICLQYFDRTHLYPNLFHSARHIPARLYKNSSLKLAAQLLCFRFPLCQFQQHFNNSSCSIFKILYQNFAVLQIVFSILLSLPSLYSAAPLTVLVGNPRTLLQIFSLHIICNFPL
jgi:hypothetical protein